MESCEASVCVHAEEKGVLVNRGKESLIVSKRNSRIQEKSKLSKRMVDNEMLPLKIILTLEGLQSLLVEVTRENWMSHTPLHRVTAALLNII